MARGSPSTSKRKAATRGNTARPPRDRRDKLSISLDPTDVLWVTRKARRAGTSVSAVLAEAIAEQRRADATAELLGLLGGTSDLTPEELARARAEMLEP